MQASSSSSSSSQNPREDMSLTNRVKSIFKKAHELSTLCGVELCVIHYGPDGKLKTWPADQDKVKDMALRYNAAEKRKNSLNLYEFLEEEKAKNKPEKKQRRLLENVKYPNFDDYSPNQLCELDVSLKRALSTIQERLSVIETRKQRNTNLVDQYSMNQHHQTQPLNPNKFSLFMYNHQDDTLSKLTLPNYQNQVMKQEPCGLGHDIINTNYFQQPCFSNTEDSSTLLLEQESSEEDN